MDKHSKKKSDLIQAELLTKAFSIISNSNFRNYFNFNCKI